MKNSFLSRFKIGQFILLSVYLSAFSISASSQNFEWAGNIGGANSGIEHKGGLAADFDGNSYMAFTINGQVDVDPGNGVTTLIASNKDACVTKVGVDGNLVWAAHLSGNFDAWAIDVAAAPDGGVVAIGHFAGTVDFDPGAGVTSITSQGDLDLFVVKLNSSGNLVWVKTFSTNADFSDVLAHAVSIDPLGNIAVSGEFRGNMTLAVAGNPVSISSVNGESDYFLFQMNSAGDVLWGRNIGSSDFEGGLGGNARTDVASGADGSVYMIGQLKATIVFDGSAPNGTLSPPGGNIDIFVVRYNGNGSLNWVKGFGGSDDDGWTEDYRMGSLAYGTDGKLTMASSVTGVVELAPGISAGSGFGINGFVAQMEEDGTLIWARTSQSYISGIATDAAGYIYCTGMTGNGANMDIGFSNTTISFSSFFGMPFLTRFDDQGILDFVGGFDAPSPNNSQAGYGLAASGGYVYVSGDLRTLTDFNPGSGETLLSPFSVDGQASAFLVQFTSPIPDCISATQPTVTVIGGNTVCQGTSATIELNGELNDNSNWVWTNGNTCNGTLIGTGSSITFIPQASGTWSVYGLGGCQSGPCQSFDLVVEVCTNVEEALGQQPTLFYTNHLAQLNISTENPADLLIVDVSGKTVINKRVVNQMEQVALNDLTPGMYVAVLRTDAGVYKVLRFIR